MTTTHDRFLTGSLTGSFSRQSQHRFPVPSPTGTGTGATGSPQRFLDEDSRTVHPMKGNPMNTPQKEPAPVVAPSAETEVAKAAARDHHLIGVSMYETTCSCGGWPAASGPSHHVEHVVLAAIAALDLTEERGSGEVPGRSRWTRLVSPWRMASQ